MDLKTLIALARDRGASDIHLDAGRPAALRVSSQLIVSGEPIPGESIRGMALEVIGQEGWESFLAQGSWDVSRTLAGVRCRINVMKTSRGIGMAIRLLSSFHASVEKLNLHPDLKRLIDHQHGLILVSGPTGSGKSSTMAALIQELNAKESRNVITIEHPIEYVFRPQRCFIRQREVGRDTPSFDQALIDAMRGDPDVLMVGEMRDPETMRLTLNASETGHLVLATIHSASAVEALQRLILAFPAEIQNSISTQLADCLVAVICQRLRYSNEFQLRLPECEVLIPTHAVKNFIRRAEFHQIMSAMETGADHGMWTFTRYRAWMTRKRDWFIPSRELQYEPVEDSAPAHALIHTAVVETSPKPILTPSTTQRPDGRIEIEPDEGSFGKILKT